MNIVEQLIYAAAKDFLFNRANSFYTYDTYMAAIDVVHTGNVRELGYCVL